MKKSIRTRVITVYGSLMAITLLMVTALVLFVVHSIIHVQVQKALTNRSFFLAERLEQRLSYLVENSELLTSNHLMVNALTDAEGRENYLTPLVENFMEGKDVVSLNVVDFDGRPIFKTQEEIPRYNESTQLRDALAIGVTSVYLQKRDQNMVVVAPIKYYDTTQGAVVIVFDLQAVATRQIRSIENESFFMKLVHNGAVVFRYNYDPKKQYTSYRYSFEDKNYFLHQLGIEVEMGLPTSLFNAPLKKALFILVVIGLFSLLVGIFSAYLISHGITKPILELYARVKAADKNNDVLCSPLGTHDELDELARAFDERTLKLQYQAEHDSLTDLPNRVLFIDRLNQAIKRHEEDGTIFAVLFLDLDRFKEVNDSFGHQCGDELLKVVSAKMEKALSQRDSIARIGGDEFTILLNGNPSEKMIADTVIRLMQVFEAPMSIHHHNFFITCSIGIALYPQHGQTSDVLLKNADTAMYKAKDEGRNTYRFYTDDLTDRVLERVTMETDLKQAIVNNEFEVYYQPQVDIRTKQIHGMEALIRWQHPTKGFITPDTFIPLAEETGLIIEIDRWMMRTSMQQFVKWQKQGLKPGVLSINLSMIQLNDEDFLDAVNMAISDSNISTKSVMFEVTETQVMRNPEQAIILLNDLKKLGVGLAIDDFGTGHSSLSYLKRLPVEKIKIDQSFVRDIPYDADDMTLTKAIIALSRSLQLNIIAEGVETEEQANFLLANNCTEAQGYLYYKPQSSTDMTVILQNQ